MSDFISDEDMQKLEQPEQLSSDSAPDFISDEEISAVESAPVDSVEIPETLQSLIGGTIGAGVGEGARRGTSAVLDPLAEKLAYTAAGGHDTPSGKKLVEAIAGKTPGKNFGIVDAIKTAPEQVKELLTNTADSYDDGVNPRSVGRQILDEKLLGPFGLGMNENNYSRSISNLSTKSIPTNAILNSIEEYPISQEGILNRMKDIVGYDKLNETVDQQALIKSKIDNLQNDKKFSKQETPMVAERAKRDLQKGVDFADPEKTAKEALNAAQSTARKEAVENAVLNAFDEEKLNEFKRLKAQSGSAGVASDIFEETLKKGQRSPNPISSISGAIGDLFGKKLPGVGAAAFDTASKFAKSGVGKIAIPGAGALIGGTVGALAADENTEPSDFIPGLDQAGSVGSAMDDKLIQTEVKARQNYEQSGAGKDAMMHGMKTISKSSPEQLMELSNQFKQIKGADKFVAPLENAANASSDEEKRARLFGLYQQPAFRQLIKGRTVEEE